jgi:hypothetical protein
MNVTWGQRHDEVMKRYKQKRESGQAKELVVVTKN